MAITGASGLVGSALASRLRRDGCTVVPVVRRKPNSHEIGWSVVENRIDHGAFDDIDVVVHLAGAGIADKRWSAAYKNELWTSRSVGTQLIAGAVASARKPPSVLLSSSSIGYYGPSQSEMFDESSAPGEGFLADLCVAWEEAAMVAASEQTRVVTMRTGLVLSADGGALGKQLPIFRLGLGGKIGDGTQRISWISIGDMVEAILHLMTSELSGAVNVSAPNPTSNAEFAKALGRQLRRPTILPIPKFAPSILLGRELCENLLFTGQNVVPAALQNDGFSFGEPTIESAFQALLPR